MSDIGSQSGANRPSLSDGTSRVARTERAHGQSRHPAEGGQSGSSQTPSHDSPSRHGHHDPAVSLSATLGRVNPGARITGSVIEIDPEDRLVIRSAQGTFLLDFEGEIPPSIRQADRILLQVTQTDHSIEARIVEANGRPLASPPDVRMTLVRVPTPASPQSPLPDGSGASTSHVAYRPLPDAMTLASAGIQRSEALPLVIPLPADGVIASSVHTRGQGGPNNAGTAPQTPAQPPGNAPGNIPAKPGILSFIPLPDGDEVTTPGLAPLPAGGKVSMTVSQQTAPHLSPDLVKRPPAVAAGLSFVAQWLPPTAPAQQTGHKAIAPNIRAGQIVHVTVDPAAINEPEQNPTAAQKSVDVAPVKPDGNGNRTVMTTGIIQTDGAGPRKIQTPLGAVSLPNENTLPNGTRVSLTVGPVTTATQTAAQLATAPPATATGNTPDKAQPAPPVAGPAMILSRAGIPPLADYADNWPALSALVSGALVSTGTANGISSGHMIAGKLPTADNPITPVTLLFLNVAGIKSPLQLLLGQRGIEAMDGGEAALLRAIESDLARMKALRVDHAGLEWRPHMLPVQTETGVQALFMLVRHAFDQEDNRNGNAPGTDDKERKKVTRFILDLSFSNLGPLQVDGMIRSRRFDLILHSTEPLGNNAADDIEKLFRTALDRNGFTGDCSFLSGRAFPVNVANAIREAEIHRPPISA